MDWWSREMAAGLVSGLGSTTVAIPHGVWRDGSLVREVRLRPVAGDDHAFLLDSEQGVTPDERATALLARCIDEEDPGALVASLVVGDREALLLQLRRLTIGEALECVVSCPASECGEPLELELRVDDLLVDAYEEPQPTYELAVGPEASEIVRFRLPTVADVRAAASRRNDADEIVADLLARCLATSDASDPLPAVELDTDVNEALAAALADRDPQAEIELDLVCPACATPFSVVLDTANYLLKELDAQAAALFEEVHALAYYYHWSEHDILAMAPTRRERYLGLLADTLRSASGAGYAAT